MKRTVSVISGVVIGAGLMYMADPQQGARRRAIGRDRAAHVFRRRALVLRGLVRHLGNRARGALAVVHPDGHADVPEQALVARIRSKIGHVVSHPHQVEVTVSQGHLVLAGHVLETELHRLLKTVEGVPGVASVKHTLTVHQSPEHVMALEPRRIATNHRAGRVVAAAFAGLAAGVLLARTSWSTSPGHVDRSVEGKQP